MIWLPKKNRAYCQSFGDESGQPAGALMTFTGKINKELIGRFRANLNTQGDHIRTGGAMSPLSMLTLIGSGAGALGTAGALSGQLFVATANPATLMAIGQGVGSAVMGAGGGIVAQAPFVAVAGGLMPVVAPLLAFQAISTIMIMNKFDGIHKRLDVIEKNVSRIIQRAEATFVGELLSAASRLDELEQQFEMGNRFTPEMVIRLCLLESTVNPIFERFRFLYEMQRTNKSSSREDLEFKKNDAYFTIMLSICDLRLDLLRLRLAIQEHPGFMIVAAERLITKSRRYKEVWQAMGTDPERIKEVASDLREVVDGMSWWSRTMPSFLGGKRRERKEMEVKAMDFDSMASSNNDALLSELTSAELLANDLEASLASQQGPGMDLMYWRDELGEHSYYTNDLQIIPKTQIA